MVVVKIILSPYCNIPKCLSKCLCKLQAPASAPVSTPISRAMTTNTDRRRKDGVTLV